MERRIFGIENEYGITCTFDGQRRLTPDEVARMVGLTAAGVYRFDLEVLRPVADRIGPAPAQVATPLAPDEVPAIRGRAFAGEGAGRAAGVRSHTRRRSTAR